MKETNKNRTGTINLHKKVLNKALLLLRKAPHFYLIPLSGNCPDWTQLLLVVVGGYGAVV